MAVYRYQEKKIIIKYVQVERRLLAAEPAVEWLRAGRCWWDAAAGAGNEPAAERVPELPVDLNVS